MATDPGTLRVLYEDAGITVLVKPAGVTSEEGPCSVPGFLRARWGNPKAYVGVVHRLDTATGGVMVYARTPKAAARLSTEIQEGGFRKQYLCVSAGAPEPAAGEMHDWLFKDSRQNKVFPVKGARKGAREALLEYELLAGADTEAGQHFSLCRVLLHTGRTHQVRVQFASRKQPLYGDGKYGSRVKGPLGLWCWQLRFAVPGAGEETFTALPPAEGGFALFPQPEDLQP